MALKKIIPLWLALSLFTLMSPLCTLAAESLGLSKGQTVYVPAYSNIYHGNKDSPLSLSVTLSIRNISPTSAFTLTMVNYYDTEGELVRPYLSGPVTIRPLGTMSYVIPQKDETGGAGANFIVEWHAAKPISPPIIESVMIGTQNQLGVSFTSRGEAVHK